MHTDKKMINTDTANAKSEEYKYQDLTGLILKSAFEVHNTLIHKAQTLNYLKASGYEVALILNFAKPRLEYKRVVR